MERDSAGFTDWLSGYVQEFGLDHQICLAHVRKNVRRRLRDIDGWDWFMALPHSEERSQ